MAISLKHTTQTVVADDGTSPVGADEWNEEHALQLATDRLIGRATAGTGAAEEITCTAAGRALLDDADAATQRATIGIVTGATDNAALRADGTGGATTQGSPLLIADTTGALSRSGNGGIPLQGTNTNDAAAAGYVGEYVESIVATGSAVALTSGVGKTVTSISLTAGDWDVHGNIHLKAAASTNISLADAAISTADNTIQTGSGTYASLSGGSAGLVPNTSSNPSLSIPSTRISVSSTTTIYLVAYAAFSVDTLSAFGQISARRMR